MIAASTSNARSTPAAAAFSPAKINLSLEVLGRREDGYHDICSVVLGLDLNDTLRLESLDHPAIDLTCDHPTLPTDDRNLIVRAARAAAELTDHPAGVRIDLKKRIPLGAGLGGGSGNAASTLAALNTLWRLDRTDAELAECGARLGSDVPLFFSLPSAVITGRGERVRRVRLRWSGWVLLVFAGCEVSTEDVYASWSRDDSHDMNHDVAGDLAEAATADAIAELCANDLEAAVFRVAPRVRELHEAVTAKSPRAARITGAGQTVFVPFDDPEEGEFLRSTLHAHDIGTDSSLVHTMTGPLITQ